MAEIVDETVTTDLIYDGWRKRLDAIDDNANTDEDHSIKIDVLANDVGALGIVKVNGKPIAADTPPVTLESGATVDLEGRTLLYDPGAAFQKLNSGESGSDKFTYTIVGYGKRTDTATVNVTIAGENDDPGANHPPVANNDYAVLPDYYPYPLPYAEGADSITATTTDASLSDDLIYTTLAIGEEGPPDPYPSSVQINVLANDKDPDGDPLKVATIAGKKVDTDPTTDPPDTVTLSSGAEVTLNAEGSLTYSKGIIVYSDTDPLAQTEQAVTLKVNSDGSSALVPIDPILPPEPLPYPGPLLADRFTYTATDDEGAESNAATVTVYRAFYDYILGAEPVADASAAVASNEPNDLLLT